MSEQTDRHKFAWVFEKLPGWLVIELEDAGIPHAFKLEDLTPEQKDDLVTLTWLSTLYYKGLIRVEVDPETNVVTYYAVQQGSE